MTPSRLARGLTHAAVTTVRHPVSSGARAVGVARGAWHTARQTPAVVLESLVVRAQRVAHDAFQDTGPTKQSERRTEPAEAAETQPPARTVDDAFAEARANPLPDLTPPDPADRVLVVEEALQAGEQPPSGRATEPSATSRDDEHGEAPLQLAEELAWEEEAAEVTPVGQPDLTAPVSGGARRPG